MLTTTFLLTLLTFTSVHSACEKSFVTICDSLSDVPHNPSRKTWRELLIQSKYAKKTQQHSLTSKQLNFGVSNLKWLIINKQLSNLERGAFAYCKNLEQLILYGNDLKTIKSRTFLGFGNLLKLGLENNNIDQIEANAFVLSTIEIVDLSHNKLHVLSSGSFKKCSIGTLIALHNELWKIDSNSLPKDLKRLHLDHNSFDSLPQEVNTLHQLKELTISYNKLFDVPDLSELQSLEKLDFSFNRISSLGHQFDNLPKLKVLDLSSNHLEKFTLSPQLVGHIQDGFWLLLAHNRLRNLDLEGVKSVDVTVTLSGNPWNCKCMDGMLEVIWRNKIGRTECDHRIFSSGLSPYCVVDDGGQCSDNRVSASAFEKFRHSFRSDCDVFSDTDKVVN